MRIAIVLPLAAALSLAGCNKAGSGSDAGGGSGSTPEKVVAAVSEMKIQPGLYQATVAINSIEMPGMPAAIADAVKKGMAGKPMTYCISAEEAANGIEAMKKHMGDGKCQFDRFEASGGKIDQSMTCQSGRGTMHMVGHGTYDDSGSVVTATADMAGPGGKGMHIEEVVTTKRIGDCAK